MPRRVVRERVLLESWFHFGGYHPGFPERNLQQIGCIKTNGNGHTTPRVSSVVRRVTDLL